MSTKRGDVEGVGGGFRFCELGEPLFDEGGKIRETVSFADLARHVYFTETGEPLSRERVTDRRSSACAAVSASTCSTTASWPTRGRMAATS